MSDGENKITFEWGDDPEHIVSVRLGDEVVKLEVRDPFEVMQKMVGYGSGVSKDTMGDLLGCVWPTDIGDGAEAFAYLFPQYRMSDLQVAVSRLADRVSGMFPSEEEVAERAAFFPDSDRGA